MKDDDHDTEDAADNLARIDIVGVNSDCPLQETVHIFVSEINLDTNPKATADASCPGSGNCVALSDHRIVPAPVAGDRVNVGVVGEIALECDPYFQRLSSLVLDAKHVIKVTYCVRINALSTRRVGIEINRKLSIFNAGVLVVIVWRVPEIGVEREVRFIVVSDLNRDVTGRFGCR